MTDEKTNPTDEVVEPAAGAEHASGDDAARSHFDAGSPADGADDEGVRGAEASAHDARPDESVHDSGHTTADGVPVQYGVGPLSIREAALAGVWAIAFVVSFFPAFVTVFGRFAIGESVWNGGLDWVLTIGLPTVAVFLVLLRRFSPQGIRRVGSLGIDQFASVAFSVAAVVWLTALWGAFVDLVQRGVFTVTWVAWVEFFLMIVGVALTVLAPYLPVVGDDFRHRDEKPAHRNARPIRPIAARPPRPVTVDHGASADAGSENAGAATTAGAAATAGSAVNAEQPYGGSAGQDSFAAARDDESSTSETGSGQAWQDSYAGDQQATDAYASSDWSGGQARDGATDPARADDEPFAYLADSASEPATEAFVPVQQAFWALVPEARDVVDEQGAPLFRIDQTAWALVIEDRGEVFVVRHEDGRVGYLHDVSGVTRG